MGRRSKNSKALHNSITNEEQRSFAGPGYPSTKKIGVPPQAVALGQDLEIGRPPSRRPAAFSSACARNA